MVTEKSTGKEVIQEIGNTVNNYTELISTLDEKQVNQIPYENSWTAGELFNHVTKSVGGMAEAMRFDGKAAERNSNERVNELKTIFLDFTTQMNSPDFIIPDQRTYEKEKTKNELLEAFNTLNSATENADLDVLLEDLPFGAVTKYELLHFTLYHTQRHENQLRKIVAAL